MNCRALLLALLPASTFAAVLSGHLSAPVGAVPPLHVYAWSNNGRLLATATAAGQTTYRLELPPGDYRVFATPADPGVPLVYAGHTQCSLSEDATGCSTHALRWVHVDGSGATRADVGDWRLDDSTTAALDHALHHDDGAGELDPSATAPRYFEYPADALRRAHAQQLAGGNVRTADRERLNAAFASGRINFGGRGAVVGPACNGDGGTAYVIDLATGHAIPIPPSGDGHAATACADRLGYRRDSRLLRVAPVGADDGDGQYYVWEPDSATLRPLNRGSTSGAVHPSLTPH